MIAVLLGAMTVPACSAGPMVLGAAVPISTGLVATENVNLGGRMEAVDFLLATGRAVGTTEENYVDDSPEDLDTAPSR